MPLEATDAAEIDAFCRRKLAQWESVKSRIDGLQMVQSGEQRTQFVLTGPNGERVIFGQMPHVVVKTAGIGRNAQRIRVANDQKPVEKRAIDLADGDLAAVIAVWSTGGSAASLSFVVTV